MGVHFYSHLAVRRMSLISEYMSFTEKHRSEYGPKTLVFMQVGAFYEIYGLRDPETGEITGSLINEFANIVECAVVNKKTCVGKYDVVMAGFRDYMLDKYLKKMQEEGYTVAVYSQDANMKKTTRSLTCVCSAGTYFSTDVATITNNIMCIWIEVYFSGTKNTVVVGVSTIDVLTGHSSLTEYTELYHHTPTTFDELERLVSIYNPSETIIIHSGISQEKSADIVQFANIRSPSIHMIDLEDNKHPQSLRAIKCEKQKYQREIFKTFWEIADIDAFFSSEQFDAYPIATQAYCFLLDFIHSHNPNLVHQIAEPTFAHADTRLVLANHSLKQLNIIATGDVNKRQRFASVAGFLNHTQTPMGRRKMEHTILNPITDCGRLRSAYGATDYFLAHWGDVEAIRRDLGGMRDLERAYRRIIMGRISPAEFIYIYDNLGVIGRLCGVYCGVAELGECGEGVAELCGELRGVIEASFDVDKARKVDNVGASSAPSAYNDGGAGFDANFFKRGLYEDVDRAEWLYGDALERVRAIQGALNDIVATAEKKTKTDDTEYVKIHCTDSLGYSLIATSRRVKLLDTKMPAVVRVEYANGVMELKKTEFAYVAQNASGMRICHPIINEACATIVSAHTQLRDLLKLHYSEHLATYKTKEVRDKLDVVIGFVVDLDVFQCRAYVARANNYVSPVIDDTTTKSFIRAKGLRHALIEHINTNETYVPNDVELGTGVIDGMLLFGTNAVGKSSLIKSIGIAVIMAQSGFHVPAREFVYRPYNYIFTRILGNDNLFKGLSTFAVEMCELRTILRKATENSLILGDELCSGTETSSAIGIFSAGLITLHERRCTFLFATHFHEVLELPEVTSLGRMCVKHMSVKYDRTLDALVYDRKLCDGAGDAMYGLEVCKSLALPNDFLELAHNLRKKKTTTDGDVSRFNSAKVLGACELCGGEGVEVHHMSYQKDANANGFIDDGDAAFHKNHPANLMNICDKCHDTVHKTGRVLKRKKTAKGMKIM